MCLYCFVYIYIYIYTTWWLDHWPSPLNGLGVDLRSHKDDQRYNWWIHYFQSAPLLGPIIDTESTKRSVFTKKWRERCGEIQRGNFYNVIHISKEKKQCRSKLINENFYVIYFSFFPFFNRKEHLNNLLKKSKEGKGTLWMEWKQIWKDYKWRTFRTLPINTNRTYMGNLWGKQPST